MSSPDLAFQTVLAEEIATAVPGVEAGSHPAQNQAMPYIQFGESEVSDTFVLGHEILMLVHVWSNKEGPHEVKTHQHAIREALHEHSFEKSGWTFSCIREDFAETLFDPEAETWHGVQRFRALASVT